MFRMVKKIPLSQSFGGADQAGNQGAFAVNIGLLSEKKTIPWLLVTACC